MRKFGFLTMLVTVMIAIGLLSAAAQDVAGPLPVIESYQAAIAAGDVAAAATLFDANAILAVHAGPLVVASGTDAISAWLTNAISDGATSTQSTTPIVEDNKVFWRGTLTRDSWAARNVAPLEGSWEVVVTEGKIISFKFVLTPASLVTLETAGFGTSASGVGAVAGTFAGFVPGTEGILAIATDGVTFAAYLCDGVQDQPATLADWFRGAIVNNSINLTLENGASIVGTLAATNATGIFTLADGTALPFDVPLISGQGNAGLFRAEVEIDGVAHVLGWTTLPDGQARGAGGFVANGGTRELVGLNYVEQESIVVTLPSGTVTVIPRRVVN